MIIIKLHDKRHAKGYTIRFFDTDTVTKEIIAFVKMKPRAYFIGCNDAIYSREEFLEKYGRD